MEGIWIQELSFSYGNRRENICDSTAGPVLIIHEYSAHFPEGEVSVIMAPSGSGKTTLLFLIAGLLPVQKGRIVYSMEQPKCSMVFQDGRLVENLSVQKNIQMVNGSLSEAEVEECLVQLGLEGFQNKKVRKLSGGEKQRVAIARALLADYDILLLDEPFTGLDQVTKEKVIGYIKRMAAGKTILLVTHDKTEAQLMGGRLYEGI